MRKFGLILVFVLLFGVFGSFVSAQGTEPTVEPTPVATEVPSEPEVPVEENETVVNIWTIIVAVVGAFIGGATTGSLTAVWLIRRIAADKQTVAALEKLLATLPEETREKLFELANTFDEAVELAKEVLDGVPVTDKP